MNSYQLAEMARAYGDHEGLSHWAVSYRVARKGDLFRRFELGRSCTIDTYVRIIQWFSNHWPADLPWPPDIPRPASSESVTQPSKHRNGSPAPSPDPAPADPVAAVKAAQERMHEAMLKGDSAARLEAQQAALVAGSTLGSDGTVASPEALCLALGVEKRNTFYKVVSVYADGRPGERKSPRTYANPSDTERILQALVDSGDRRFECRRDREATGAALRGTAMTGVG